MWGCKFMWGLRLGLFTRKLKISNVVLKLSKGLFIFSSRHSKLIRGRLKFSHRDSEASRIYSKVFYRHLKDLFLRPAVTNLKL